jgi:hypothetical protein
VGFVVDKAALGQVFSKYFGSPANHSTNFSIIIITRGGTIDILVAAAPSGPNWTPNLTIPIKEVNAFEASYSSSSVTAAPNWSRAHA